jgi:hypothetical protein
MKKILFLLLAAAPFVFAACGDEEESGGEVTKEQLAGKWKFESVKVKELITNNEVIATAIKLLIPQLPELINVNNIDLPDYAEFTEDGSVYLGTLGEGTFSVSGNKLTVITSEHTEVLAVSFINGKLAVEKDVTDIVQKAVNEEYPQNDIIVNKAVVFVNFGRVANDSSSLGGDR